MAWLSGLAGKAENLLNKIDQNTAAVLSNERNSADYEHRHHHHHSSQKSSYSGQSPQHENFVRSENAADSPRSSTSSLRSVRSSDANVKVATTSTTLKIQEEDELMTYLNSPNVTPSRIMSLGLVATGPPSPSSLIVEASTENSDSTSDLVIQSGHASPELTRVVVNVSDNETFPNDDKNWMDENALLRQEIERLRNEFATTGRPETSTTNDHDYLFRQKIENNVRLEYESRLAQQRIEMEELAAARSGNVNVRKSLQNAKKSLVDKTEMINKQQTDHQKEIDALNEKLQYYKDEIAENLKKLNETQSSLERCRSELNTTRVDLEQHRARALRTLQEKEKLIAELRNNSTLGSDNDTTIMELNQLRQECEALREENQQVREQLRISREELAILDLKVEETNRKAIETSREAHDVISTERRKRIEAEEDARFHLEEVRNLRDELETQHVNWTTKFRKQDSEITRLRSQLSAASTPSSAVETRLASLTQTLVSKQQALESLTTEKNALRLQLEKMEQDYRKMMANSRKNGYNSVNDTDDAKAQVPTFFLESPFDTGVTRRVKRAYSTLDAISVRIGIFLRRYPLARILVIIYMALLQFWVLVVLLFQSPDAH